MMMQRGVFSRRMALCQRASVLRAAAGTQFGWSQRSFATTNGKGILNLYNSLVETGELRADPAQITIVNKLEDY